MKTVNAVLEPKTSTFQMRIGSAMDENSKDAAKVLAMAQLMTELKRGEESAEKDGWLNEEEVMRNLGVVL